MSHYTAQVFTATNVVKAVTDTARPLENPPQGVYFVQLDGYHGQYAGWTYNPVDHTFTPPPAD